MSADPLLYQRHLSSARQATEQCRDLRDHPSYRLSFADDDFLMQDELRHVRLQLEYLKPQLILEQHQIQATVVVFGSARFLSPEQAQLLLQQAQQQLEQRPDDPDAKLQLKTAQRQLKNSRYYQAAEKFAALVTRHSQQQPEQSLMIISGGGPGVMEAANKGASLAGGQSIGLNIVLPHEQKPNPYITPEFCFRFHYFAIRKMHFLQRARALVAFPGGFGTLDELFETLTLLQTGKATTVPVILYDKSFWTRLINFDLLVEEGLIKPEDLELIQFVDTPEQAWQAICQCYKLGQSL
ncbi:TIGR00730 family Rossman fold protein [Rheinheimera mesophila]|uniref:Cytokinin riboside 5'-monophosphate phosphoribohydrolase n=1 Tax=Rheinheimera mesophila TaxID=1547515 RepID=A0A3P3QRB2_9GAMM|nr:TIGR00730 family Rossman fold protein [Rheinheimera mesophila]KKL03286.1 3-isopropylmalate dehydrogenase [Rheinheimera mesophila]RRJ23585.1 TIGR00730 family Rossman fold protein [Rheinheimera mesophila]